MNSSDVKIRLTADDKTRAAFASANSNLQKLQAGAAKLSTAFGALGVAVSVGALATFAKSSIDAADSLNDMSDRLGVSVRDLASFKLAAELADTSLEGVGAGIARLSRSIGDAEGGNKKLSDALSTLGITARDPKEAFIQLADAVQRIKDPATKAALLNQVLGKSYQDLLPLLNQGGEALRKSAQESESFADAMERLAPEAGKFNDQLDILKNNAATAAAKGLVPLVTSFNEYAEAMKDVLENGSLLEKAGFFTLGFITEGSLNRISDAGKRVQDYNTEIFKLQQELVHLKNVAGPEASIVKKYEADIARLQKTRAGLIEQARKDAAAAFDKPGGDPNPPGIARPFDKLGLYNDEMARNAKLVADETQRIAGDLAFMRDVDLAQNNPIAEMEQDWIEAGRALKEQMMTPLEKLNVELGRLDTLFEKGAIDFETYARAVHAGFEGIAPKVDKVKTFAEELGDAFTDTFKSAGSHIRNVGDLLDTLKSKLASVFANRASEYAANWISDAFFKPSADGNVFNSPALSAYSGSVVSSPTLFPFANGIGLMGEAGAEAILPLKRGRDGKLGVSMDSGGGGVVIQYNIDARGADAGVEQRIRRALDDTEDRAVSRAVNTVQSMNQRGHLRLT